MMKKKKDEEEDESTINRMRFRFTVRHKIRMRKYTSRKQTPQYTKRAVVKTKSAPLVSNKQRIFI